MNGIYLIIAAVAVYWLAYRIYGRFLSVKLDIDDKNPTPSHTNNDGIDYMPAKTPVLFGHHFASIAGVGPIVGPVLALSFGWVPVYAWVLAGAVLIGGVHDYTSIIASIRHKGKSIGSIIETYLGISGKRLFILFAWATLILVIAVFTIIIADTLVSIPSVGTSSVLFILLAVLFGLALYRLNLPLWITSILGIILLFAAMYAGQLFPIELDRSTWQIIIFVYIFIASVVPVWILLQPRDYLNSFFLYALMIGGVLGLFFTAPEINAPAFTSFNSENLGFLFPALFVTVACGAISGFHSIVGSGTTSKQLNKESDAKTIGYGGMLLEGLLAVLSLLAVSALATGDFQDLLATQGPVTAFSVGLANFINNIPLLNISFEAAKSFVALAVAAFALTSLDTATRLARYLFQEFFEDLDKKSSKSLLRNRFFATGITLFFGIILTSSGQTMVIWPIFGSANQLLAALGLLAVTVWMAHLQKKYLFSLIPMIFMFVVTLSALLMLFYENILINNNYFLAFVTLSLFLLSVVLGKFAIQFMNNMRRQNSL